MSADTNTDYTALLQTLEKIQQHDFIILKLSESISPTPQKDSGDLTRSSDVSNAFDISTPAALQADLSHYKELFSKLRFSYLEQVTKEKFLRAITEEPPLIVEPSENAALEKQLATSKAELQASKASVDEILTSLESLSNKLAEQHSAIAEYVTLARTLPAQTAVLEARIGELKQEQESAKGDMHLPLADTIALLSEREAELARLEMELEGAERELPGKKKVLERLEREIVPLEMDKEVLEKSANETVRMKDSAGAEGRADRETMGRWYKSVFEGLEALLPGKR